MGALHQALDTIELEGVRAVVIRGEGRHFCTGFDLSQIASLTDADLLQQFVEIERLLARIWAAPYMTIVIAQGRVIGAGADLFAACSRRIGIDGSSFAFPGASFGLILGTRRLGRRIGVDAALHLIASGTTLEARAALATGLATTCVTEAELPVTLESEINAALRLDAGTLQAVREASIAESVELDRDLAALVRSAAQPGLRERIIAYQEKSLLAKASQSFR